MCFCAYYYGFLTVAATHTRAHTQQNSGVSDRRCPLIEVKVFARVLRFVSFSFSLPPRSPSLSLSLPLTITVSRSLYHCLSLSQSLSLARSLYHLRSVSLVLSCVAPCRRNVSRGLLSARPGRVVIISRTLFFLFFCLFGESDPAVQLSNTILFDIIYSGDTKHFFF